MLSNLFSLDAILLEPGGDKFKLKVQVIIHFSDFLSRIYVTNFFYPKLKSLFVFLGILSDIT